MAEDTKKSVDLKNLDLKDVGGLLKAAFGKDSNAMSNPTMLFIVFAFLASFILAYLIYGMIDNQTLYDQEQTKYNQTTSELATLTKKFDKTIKGNKEYFTQLFSSPKTDDELSARITKLVSNYNLKLVNIDLQKKLKGKKMGIALEVRGGYVNLVKFSKELNKNVAASQILNLEANKKRKSKLLDMKLTLVFAAPPNPDSIPKYKPATVSAHPIKNFAHNIKQIFDYALSSIVSHAHAEQKEMTDFQKALYEAKKAGLYDFEFTNKAGKTMVYTTGIPKSEATAPSVKKEMTAFQKALYDAKQKGLVTFEFTKKDGKTMTYKTGLSESAVANLPEIAEVAKTNVLPPLQNNETVEIFTDKQYLHTPVQTEIITNKEYKADNFKKAGFVETDPFAEPSDTPAIEEEIEEAPSEALRDPFAPPEVRKAAKRKSSGGEVSDEEEDQYYLSGVLVSDEMSLCIIITPDGESKIYAPGDKISNKVMLTNIAFDSIQINKLNKKKVIGLGEQVN
tara:strand:+ start:2490 stop:4013 length:1524 start_codon:yes stop_codon:yes gene_type:complete